VVGFSALNKIILHLFALVGHWPDGNAVFLVQGCRGALHKLVKCVVFLRAEDSLAAVFIRQRQLESILKLLNALMLGHQPVSIELADCLGIYSNV